MILCKQIMLSSGHKLIVDGCLLDGLVHVIWAYTLSLLNIISYYVNVWRTDFANFLLGLKLAETIFDEWF